MVRPNFRQIWSFSIPIRYRESATMELSHVPVLFSTLTMVPSPPNVPIESPTFRATSAPIFIWI